MVNMKINLVLATVMLIVVSGAYGSNEDENTCSIYAEKSCENGGTTLTDHCNGKMSGFAHHHKNFHAFANLQLAKSYDYLLLAQYFGNHLKNRPGFQKQFQALADKAWESAMNLIQHSSKRGIVHDFSVTPTPTNPIKTLELFELQALALALDIEKKMSIEAHLLHNQYTDRKVIKKTANGDVIEYDPEIAHYLEEHFIESQADTIRKFSGYTNDLKKLLKKDDPNPSLNLHLFDEYLLSQ